MSTTQNAHSGQDAKVEEDDLAVARVEQSLRGLLPIKDNASP